MDNLARGLADRERWRGFWTSPYSGIMPSQKINPNTWNIFRKDPFEFNPMPPITDGSRMEEFGTDVLWGQPSPVPTNNWIPIAGGLGMLGAGLLRKPSAPTGGVGLLAGGLNTMGGIGQMTGSPMSPLNAPTAMPSGAGWWKRNIGSIF